MGEWGKVGLGGGSLSCGGGGMGWGAVGRMGMGYEMSGFAL